MAKVFDNVYEAAADVAGPKPIFDHTAAQVLRAVKREAASHRLTGHYMNSLGVTVAGDGKDRVVYTTDPGAIPIEFGWVPIRRVKGARRVQTAERVPGLAIFRKAYWSIPRA